MGLKGNTHMKQEGDPGWTKLMNNAMSAFLKKAVVVTVEYLPYSKCAKRTGEFVREEFVSCHWGR